MANKVAPLPDVPEETSVTEPSSKIVAGVVISVIAVGALALIAQLRKNKTEASLDIEVDTTPTTDA